MPTRRSVWLTCCAGVFPLVVVAGWSQAPLTALPENPCDLLSVKQVAAAAGVQISSANRVLSQHESLEPTTTQEPRRGSICRYDTPSELGSIAVILPDRRGPLGRRTEPPDCGTHWPPTGSEDGRVRDLGGTAAVCVGPNVVVWISVQMGSAPGGRDAARGVARAIVRRLPN